MYRVREGGAEVRGKYTKTSRKNGQVQNIYPYCGQNSWFLQTEIRFIMQNLIFWSNFIIFVLGQDEVPEFCAHPATFYECFTCKIFLFVYVFWILTSDPNITNIKLDHFIQWSKFVLFFWVRTLFQYKFIYLDQNISSLENNIWTFQKFTCDCYMGHSAERGKHFSEKA